MTRSITAALLAALAPLVPVAAKQFVEDVNKARCDDRRVTLREWRPLAEERDETAQGTAVLQTGSADFEKSAVQMKEQGVNQPGHPHEGEFSF